MRLITMMTFTNSMTIVVLYSSKDDWSHSQSFQEGLGMSLVTLTISQVVYTLTQTPESEGESWVKVVATKRFNLTHCCIELVPRPHPHPPGTHCLHTHKIWLFCATRAFFEIDSSGNLTCTILLEYYFSNVAVSSFHNLQSNRKVTNRFAQKARW